MKKKIKVVVADDSALMRRVISETLNSDPDIEVVAVARNGNEAIKLVHDYNPDVVTLDIIMPELDGINALGYIMSEIPTPCVMVSAYATEENKKALQALEYGAVDLVKKPSGEISLNMEAVSSEIIEKVKTASLVKVKKLKMIFAEESKSKSKERPKSKTALSKIIAIASSTGGTRALSVLLPKIRQDFDGAILVVQHMPEGFTNALAERLNWQSEIEVVEAEDGMEIKSGMAIIAKAGYHMEVDVVDSRFCIALTKKEPRLGLRPCADILMESVAKVFGEKAVGVVLTGMGYDGTMGSKYIKENGGIVIAESEETAIIYGMPKSVVEKGLADKIVGLDEIAKEILV